MTVRIGATDRTNILIQLAGTLPRKARADRDQVNAAAGSLLRWIGDTSRLADFDLRMTAMFRAARSRGGTASPERLLRETVACYGTLRGQR